MTAIRDWAGYALTKLKDFYLEHPNILMYAAGFVSAFVVMVLFS